ncbi:MAG: hypothetical protein ACREPW_01640 [Candidatus Binataceae bacterium]
MSDRPARNAIVAILGTPARTEGSLNDPCEREEDGVRFNEKWIYSRLHRDPAGAAMRTIYWMRYDFRGTVVRNTDAEPWRPDTALVEAATKRDDRLPPLDPSLNPPLTPSVEYRPASQFKGKSDLGGGVQEKS